MHAWTACAQINTIEAAKAKPITYHSKHQYDGLVVHVRPVSNAAVVTTLLKSKNQKDSITSGGVLCF